MDLFKHRDWTRARKGERLNPNVGYARVATVRRSSRSRRPTRPRAGTFRGDSGGIAAVGRTESFGVATLPSLGLVKLALIDGSDEFDSRRSIIDCMRAVEVGLDGCRPDFARSMPGRVTRGSQVQPWARALARMAARSLLSLNLAGEAAHRVTSTGIGANTAHASESFL